MTNQPILIFYKEIHVNKILKKLLIKKISC